MKRIIGAIAVFALVACGGPQSEPKRVDPPFPKIIGIACPAPEVMITVDGKSARDIPWRDFTPPTSGNWEFKPAGDLVPVTDRPPSLGSEGDSVLSTLDLFTSVDAVSPDRFAKVWVWDAHVLHNQERMSLILRDGRHPILTPDHLVFVRTSCSTGENPLPSWILDQNFPWVEGGSFGWWIEVRHLQPGWCIQGNDHPDMVAQNLGSGIVDRVEAAPAGDVIALTIAWNDPLCTSNDCGGSQGFTYLADGILSASHSTRLYNYLPNGSPAP